MGIWSRDNDSNDDNWYIIGCVWKWDRSPLMVILIGKMNGHDNHPVDWGARFSDWDETIPQRNGLPIQSLYYRVTHSEWDERFLLCCLVGGKDRILRILREPPRIWWFIHGLSMVYPSFSPCYFGTIFGVCFTMWFQQSWIIQLGPWVPRSLGPSDGIVDPQLHQAIVSIFVNPSQFASHEAMAGPRDLPRDPDPLGPGRTHGTLIACDWPYACGHHMGWIMLNHVEASSSFIHVSREPLRKRVEIHLSDIGKVPRNQAALRMLRSALGLGYIPAHPRGGLGGDDGWLVGYHRNYWGF